MLFCVCFFLQKEEEGEEVDTSTATASHRLPPSGYPQNCNPRCIDIACSGPFARDAHEENPESILDDHVQRVMKTPSCQSPGTGRHSPKSRSPDGFSGGKGMPPPTGQGKHPPRHGLKGEAGHLYHHKHVHHIHHTGGGKPKEQVEAEAAVRVHSSFSWAVEPNHYGSKSRTFADGMGSNPADHVGYRYEPKSNISCLFFLTSMHLNCFRLVMIISNCFLPLHSSKSGAQCKKAFKKGEEVRPYDTSAPVEDMEKKQKILLWMMEGEKEMVRHKRSPYG